jgi:carbon monoxide dehydrogenase subunit G
MQLTDEFTIPGVPPERAYELLLDLPNVAACVPGGELDAPDDDGVYAGRVTVRLGPMKFSYEGTLRIAERDPEVLTAVIAGAGKASGGAERASVRSTMVVTPEGDGSQVRMTTDLEIKGRAAQMGAGIIKGVSGRMVKQAADCLASRIAAATGPGSATDSEEGADL